MNFCHLDVVNISISPVFHGEVGRDMSLNGHLKIAKIITMLLKFRNKHKFNFDIYLVLNYKLALAIDL